MKNTGVNIQNGEVLCVSEGNEDNEQPCIQLFSKAKTKMTAEEMRKYFESYYKYLKENTLEVEFVELHFLKKENGIEELKELKNP